MSDKVEVVRATEHDSYNAVMQWVREGTIAEGWSGGATYLGFKGNMLQRTLDDVCDKVNHDLAAGGNTARVGNSMGEFIPYKIRST